MSSDSRANRRSPISPRRFCAATTAEALELLHAEAENGKDMMKLMSDLIAYLRDLLVFKVKPDALADDFNPELRKCAANAGGADRDGSAAGIDRSICGRGRPDEMGAEQEVAFRSRGHQSDPNAESGDAE